MTIYGPDTSHHQALGDFRRMKASGRCDFLFAKATEGIGFVDPQYARTRAGAKAAGIVFGSYHFARPGNPVDQANYYLSVAKPVAGELTVLDIEDTSIPDAGNWAAAWCARVEQVTGKPPLLYTYPNYLATHDFRPVLALNCGLWFADYSDPINSTAPWPTYTIRQFTDRGTIPGQPGTLDCNSSELTVAQLRLFAIGAAPAPAPLPPQPVPPPDPITPEELAMGAIYTVSTASEGIWCLMSGELYFHASPDQVSLWEKGGAKRISVPDDQHAALKARYSAATA